MITDGRMLGTQPIILHLLDIPPMLEVLKGVVMEIEDSASPLVKGVVATTSYEEAFKEVDIALLIGSFPRKEGMERSDLLEKNAAIFKDQGIALNRFASPRVKVLVVGNPANTNALICSHFAPKIPVENFSALTRLDQNRALGLLSKKLNAPPSFIHNVIVWGNHSATQFPDVSHAVIIDPHSGVTRLIPAVINDDDWIRNTFVKEVQQRGSAVIKARKLSSAASAARAIVDHIRTWIFGTSTGDFASMVVASDGSYGICRGLFFSFPVTCLDGKFNIVHQLEVDDFARSKLILTEEELKSEKRTAFKFLGIE